MVSTVYALVSGQRLFAGIQGCGTEQGRGKCYDGLLFLGSPHAGAVPCVFFTAFFTSCLQKQVVGVSP